MSATTAALAGSFVGDPDHSSFEAEARHMGVATFRTRFDEVSADLVAGSDGLALRGEAQVASIGIRRPAEFREHVLNGPDFFDAQHFPTIGFQSSEVRLGAAGDVRLQGQLTIKGRSHPITATGTLRGPVDDPFGGVRAALDLAATIDRRDYGIDWQMPLPGGGDVLSWDVGIAVHLALVAAPE